MRRTKGWWARLTKEERSALVYLERANHRSAIHAYDGYLPDDCYECPGCSEPTMVAGLCEECWDRLESLRGKANGDEESEDAR